MLLLLVSPHAVAFPGEVSLPGVARSGGVHVRHEAEAAAGRLSSPRRAAPPPAAGRPDKVVYGYLPYWTDAPADVPWDHLTHVAIFSVALNSDGTLGSLTHWTSVAADAVALGHAAGVRVHLCVTSFDGDTMDDLLASSSHRAAAVDAYDDFNRKMVGLYDLYDAQCQREGVVDFAELLLRTYELLGRNQPLREHYQARFKQTQNGKPRSRFSSHIQKY